MELDAYADDAPNPIVVDVVMLHSGKPITTQRARCASTSDAACCMFVLQHDSDKSPRAYETRTRALASMHAPIATAALGIAVLHVCQEKGRTIESARDVLDHSLPWPLSRAIYHDAAPIAAFDAVGTPVSLTSQAVARIFAEWNESAGTLRPNEGATSGRSGAPSLFADTHGAKPRRQIPWAAPRVPVRTSSGDNGMRKSSRQANAASEKTRRDEETAAASAAAFARDVAVASERRTRAVYDAARALPRGRHGHGVGTDGVCRTDVLVDVSTCVGVDSEQTAAGAHAKKTTRHVRKAADEYDDEDDDDNSDSNSEGEIRHAANDDDGDDDDTPDEDNANECDIEADTDELDENSENEECEPDADHDAAGEADDLMTHDDEEDEEDVDHSEDVGDGDNAPEEEDGGVADPDDDDDNDAMDMNVNDDDEHDDDEDIA